MFNGDRFGARTLAIFSSVTECTEMTESQAKGIGALMTCWVLLVLGALLIQPRLSERRQLLPDRYVLTADEVAALPQGTLAVVLDRRLGQERLSLSLAEAGAGAQRNTIRPGFQRCR